MSPVLDLCSHIIDVVYNKLCSSSHDATLQAWHESDALVPDIDSDGSTSSTECAGSIVTFERFYIFIATALSFLCVDGGNTVDSYRQQLHNDIFVAVFFLAYNKLI